MEYDITNEGQELIEMIRNCKKGKHNPSKELVRYTRELFERKME